MFGKFKKRDVNIGLSDFSKTENDSIIMISIGVGLIVIGFLQIHDLGRKRLVVVQC